MIRNKVVIVICFFLASFLNAELESEAASFKLKVEKAITGLTRPVNIANAGDGTNRIFIVEQSGTVRIYKEGRLIDEPFLDISRKVSCCGERGLLGLAFPHGYSGNGYFYVNYTDRSGDTVIARYRVSEGSRDKAEPGSEEILIKIDQPYSNHNGGHIAFGPDGYLYVGTGDGGSAGDPLRNGQKKDTLLGKMLRIDIGSGEVPYAIPVDNPFVNDSSYRPEIWATGLRNPWRFSFDRMTGDLYIADVGQNKYEEVNLQPSGKGGLNYGWNIMEGAHCFDQRVCDKGGLTLPIAEYGHDQGCSVTGGVVYRGKLYPELRGIYLYSDYCSGRIWGLTSKGRDHSVELLLDTSFSVSAFGEDEDGNVYLSDHKGGVVYRISVSR